MLGLIMQSRLMRAFYVWMASTPGPGGLETGGDFLLVHISRMHIMACAASTTMARQQL
jgi:hypothetical protein